MDKASAEWLKIAETDLGVARHLYETYHPQPLEIICYHCQQASEKAIKAVIVKNGAQGGIPKLHDLSFLLDQIKNIVEVDEKYYDFADELTPYGVAVRYPSELFLEERHAVSALGHATELLKWARTICEENNSKIF